MGWVIVVFIFIVVLIVSLTLFLRKKAKKTKSQDVIRPISDQPEIDVPLPPLNQTEELIEDLPKGVRLPPRINKPLTTFKPSTAQQKSYVRYDWQKIFEDSIVSPFPEDSPALPFLVEANRLEREGANPLLIEQALTEARKLDPRAYELYSARWSIIKKRQKPKN